MSLTGAARQAAHQMLKMARTQVKCVSSKLTVAVFNCYKSEK